ncbi:MAG: DUF362 domain-containing protein [Candidatus Heimdallarchaeota archaeon]
MNDISSTSEFPSVALIKGNTPKEAVLEGISKLGGISKFINEGDRVFIKINLKSLDGFPTNTNLDVIIAVISLCESAGAQEITLGSFPVKYIEAKAFTEILGLDKLFEKYGANLLLLDNMGEYSQRIIEVNKKEFRVPSEILESDKMISINQVNVDPIFTCTLGLINSYSILDTKFQEVKNTGEKNYLNLDLYKKELISNILDVFTIKKPHLIINDMFYLLENAGPFIYKDSNLKETGFVVIGADTVAVDITTLKLLKIDYENHPLLLEARNRKIGITNPSKIKIIGESLDNHKLEFKLCVQRLEDIELVNTDIKKGKFCTGCFNRAYHLLNLMKSNMTKDLKYIINQSFLIGEKPEEPESPENILIFGDCAINSTKNRSFRILITQKSKSIIKLAKNKIKRKEKAETKQKTKMVPNRRILELSGCPPDILKSIYSIIKFYGQDEVPGLNLYYNLIDSYTNLKKVEALEKEGRKS